MVAVTIVLPPNQIFQIHHFGLLPWLFSLYTMPSDCGYTSAGRKHTHPLDLQHHLAFPTTPRNQLSSGAAQLSTLADLNRFHESVTWQSASGQILTAPPVVIAGFVAPTISNQRAFGPYTINGVVNHVQITRSPYRAWNPIGVTRNHHHHRYTASVNQRYVPA